MASTAPSLPSSIEQALTDLTQQLQAAAQDRLRALVLYGGLASSARTHFEGLGPRDVSMAVALFGGAVLTGTALNSLAAFVFVSPTGSSGSGCGSSSCGSSSCSGGSSCGGGCGGGRGGCGG